MISEKQSDYSWCSKSPPPSQKHHLRCGCTAWSPSQWSDKTSATLQPDVFWSDGCYVIVSCIHQDSLAAITVAVWNLCPPRQQGNRFPSAVSVSTVLMWSVKYLLENCMMTGSNRQCTLFYLWTRLHRHQFTANLVRCFTFYWKTLEINLC